MIHTTDSEDMLISAQYAEKKLANDYIWLNHKNELQFTPKQHFSEYFS